MTKKIYLLASFVSILMVVVSTACGNTSTTKTEKVDGIEWNVSLRNTVQFNDSLTGISTYNIYTVADTASASRQFA